MATQEVDFFKKDTPHGLVKRFIWKQHIDAFIAKTQNSGYETVVFDGFSGPGRYGEEDEWPIERERYGSSLISLRAAIDFHILKKKLQLKFDPSVPITELREKAVDEIRNQFMCSTIKLYLVEEKRNNFEKLVRNAAAIFDKYGIPVAIFCSDTKQMTLVSLDDKIPVGCELFNASFQVVKPPSITRNRCMASCLDPYGFTQIPLDTVKLFVGNNKEVYITLMSQIVNRFKSQDKVKNGVEELFGLRHQDVMDKLKSYSDENIQNVANLFEDVLKEKAGARFSLSFEMCNKGNVPLYHLIFASNHKKGFEAMKEAMNNGTQSKDKFSLSDYNILKKDQKLNLKNGQVDADVAVTIFERFKGKTNVPINSVHDFILHETIHVWRKKCLKILEKNGRITKVDSDRQKRFTYPDNCRFDFSSDSETECASTIL